MTTYGGRSAKQRTAELKPALLPRTYAYLFLGMIFSRSCYCRRRTWLEHLHSFTSTLSFRVALPSLCWGTHHIMQSQWLFPISALQLTPSVLTSYYTVAKELYDRSRGVEFLFRLGSSLGLSALASFLLVLLLTRFVPQSHFRHVHSGDMVSSIFYEILHGRLSQTGILLPQSHQNAMTCFLGCRSFLHFPCHKNRGVWAEAS